MVMPWKTGISGSKLTFGRRKSVDRHPLTVSIPIPNVDRIPTPRVPITPTQVTEILRQMSSACRRGDGTRCLELLTKIKVMVKESERNRKCISSCGAGRVLAAAFSAFPGESSVQDLTLSVLTSMLPLDEEARWHIGSAESLKSIVSILDSGSPASKLNAVLLIRELTLMSDIADTDGLAEALVKNIRQTISSKMTKAALVIIFYLISSNKEVVSRFTELGLVSLLLDMLVDAERSICEKAICILDRMFSSEKCREEALNHALAVPVLVKKMFRVSETATEFAVSGLWKLCKEGGRGSVVEALQVGAFQKLLLLLQVGCSEKAKGRASDLLKLLNASRGEYECVESMDFRGLKRGF